jgi:hypothetical protein
MWQVDSAVSQKAMIDNRYLLRVNLCCTGADANIVFDMVRMRGYEKF